MNVCQLVRRLSTQWEFLECFLCNVSTNSRYSSFMSKLRSGWMWYVALAYIVCVRIIRICGHIRLLEYKFLTIRREDTLVFLQITYSNWRKHRSYLRYDRIKVENVTVSVFLSYVMDKNNFILCLFALFFSEITKFWAHYALIYTCTTFCFFLITNE